MLEEKKHDLNVDVSKAFYKVTHRGNLTFQYKKVIFIFKLKNLSLMILNQLSNMTNLNLKIR